MQVNKLVEKLRAKALSSAAQPLPPATAGEAGGGHASGGDGSGVENAGRAVKKVGSAAAGARKGAAIDVERAAFGEAPPLRGDVAARRPRAPAAGRGKGVWPRARDFVVVRVELDSGGGEACPCMAFSARGEAHERDKETLLCALVTRGGGGEAGSGRVGVARAAVREPRVLLGLLLRISRRASTLNPEH